jgi:hypothetical protein
MCWKMWFDIYLQVVQQFLKFPMYLMFLRCHSFLWYHP